MLEKRESQDDEMDGISVLMGLHRLDDFVWPAIDSILTQKSITLELIVVVNVHNHQELVKDVVKRYQNDERVRVLCTPIGQLANALNLALSAARYPYVARMDTDDIALPNRLREQLNFLREHNLDVLGTDAYLIDENGTRIGTRRMPRGTSIARLLPFRSCFIHPSIIARRAVLLTNGGYNSGFNSEDYDLWLRLRHKKIAWDNLSEPLLEYRIHSAASQRRKLGYAEVCGLMVREFALSYHPIWLLAAVVALMKRILRGR